MANPKISVIMSVYNGERYLREAIESILNQTFTDFEFIIVDDGSTDSSLRIIQGYVDERIRVIKNEENIGLTKSLNRALEKASGDYIARQDADDISLPGRFEQQVRYFEEHPQVALLGTSIYRIDKDGKILGKWVARANPDRSFSGRETQFCHGSVMFRKDVVDKLGGYDELFKHAQDYELWQRIAKHHEVRNLTHVLYKLRFHDECIGFEKAEAQALYALLAQRLSRNDLDKKAIEAIKDKGIESLYPYLDKNEKIFLHKASGYMQALNNNMKLAREEYKKVLKLNPLDFRNNINLISSYLGRRVWTSTYRIYEFFKYS